MAPCSLASMARWPKCSRPSFARAMAQWLGSPCYVSPWHGGPSPRRTCRGRPCRRTRCGPTNRSERVSATAARCGSVSPGPCRRSRSSQLLFVGAPQIWSLVLQVYQTSARLLEQTYKTQRTQVVNHTHTRANRAHVLLLRVHGLTFSTCKTAASSHTFNKLPK